MILTKGKSIVLNGRSYITTRKREAWALGTLGLLMRLCWLNMVGD
jgi:hypothetical protein